MSALDVAIAQAGDRLQQHAPLGAATTYRVGGTAAYFFTAERESDLDVLATLASTLDVPLLAIGNGSNLLVNEGEHHVIAVKLIGEVAQLTWRDDDTTVLVQAGGGLDLPIAARRLVSEGIVGFEWAVGVPGTFGGAVAMNAGGHGDDMAASVVEAVVWREGSSRTLSLDELTLAYRSSALQNGDLVLSVTLRLLRGDATTSQERLREIVRWRREHQPGGANGGSVFRNPPNDYAARLIETVGLKGERLGTAWVSEKHANFIQVDPGGRARDVFDLTQRVRERVLDDCGVLLQSENRYVGFGDAS